MRIQCIGGWAVLAAAACLVPRTAHPFTYPEHCALSNRALTLALRYATRPGDASRPPLPPLQVERLRGLAEGACDRADPETYGDLVALADFALSPVEYYTYQPGNGTFRLLLQHDDVPWQSIATMGAWRLQNLRAAHLNDDHFQERAILSHLFWHSSAVQVAGTEQRLMGALVLNAYADHFLQDFFAPGHINTPRRRLHDIPALGLHDGHNRSGGTFHLDSARVDELVPLLEVADPSQRAPCGGAAPRTCLQRLARSGVRMRGDGQVTRDARQALIITLVTARSISDVLDAFRTRSARSAFDTASWKGYRIHGFPRDTTVDGKDTTVYRFDVATPDAWMAFGGFPSVQSVERWVAETGFGVTVGNRVALGGEVQAGARLGVELMWFQLAPSSFFSVPLRYSQDTSIRQWGVAVGYLADLGDHRPIHGLSGRVILPAIELNSQLSLGGSVRFPPGDGTDLPIAAAAEARLETGFGLAFLGLTAGREFQWNAEGADARWILGSTISMGAAYSSVAGRVSDLLHRGEK